ncbi:rCG40535 [Rattus norvegicus]|uniref:RCG40535 n=1 Tax=Rattus norvegicus TaxID=10116 RepID=A6I653_RAT|nr:rCG40535 [Rattus norvegicus]
MVYKYNKCGGESDSRAQFRKPCVRGLLLTHWLLSHSHFRLVQRLTSIQDSTNLLAVFSDSALFMIRSSSSNSHPLHTPLLSSFQIKVFFPLRHREAVLPSEL